MSSSRPSPTPSPPPDTTAGRPVNTAGARPGPTPDHRYLLDNTKVEAGERFTWLAELFDGVTRGNVDRLGVTAGWRCWEVGAGGPSIPEALATAVGPTGHVLATDINPAWLDSHGTYQVLQHDIVKDPPPQPGTFDLVHARLVLVHVPDRARALATMVAALRPGGLAAGRGRRHRAAAAGLPRRGRPGTAARQPAAASRPGVDDPPRRRSSIRPYVAASVACGRPRRCRGRRLLSGRRGCLRPAGDRDGAHGPRRVARRGSGRRRRDRRAPGRHRRRSTRPHPRAADIGVGGAARNSPCTRTPVARNRKEVWIKIGRKFPITRTQLHQRSITRPKARHLVS